ncbi:zinc finger protein 664-like [Melitaea cinxia]|uniref:zinc finger protein 664-like n=1 Tax=Melitaea cinxia TaxID=113334 RepID=UPI001E27313E|nr:zinc finger protein 664-like [Melitaea cinxia]
MGEGREETAHPTLSSIKTCRQPDGNAKTKGVKHVTKVNKRIKREIEDVSEPKVRQRSVELSRHLINVREILTWSNATPIRSHTDIGYLCCYCNDYFIDPADLKRHTLENHEGINNSSFTKRRDLNAFYVKVDITGLSCRLCNGEFDTIETLIIHLKDVHKKRLFTDIKNHLISFKFENDVLKCFICSSKFSRFKGLLEHMNLHCRNFVCNICDAGFVNRKRLIVHQEKHKTGIFQCEICLEEFSTLPKKKLHIKSIHKPVKFRNKCGYCNETFKDYHQKLKHLTVVHQVEQHAYKCEACDRVYRTRKSFRVHIQRDHLLQRPHHCSECDKTFYSGSALKCHMLKHTGLREFQCDVCLKSYGRKSTLRDHMRIHADDRRFKCEHCGQAFVQKCSWRGHMRAKHGEEV